jgi:hypothetical protein
MGRIGAPPFGLVKVDTMEPLVRNGEDGKFMIFWDLEHVAEKIKDLWENQDIAVAMVFVDPDHLEELIERDAAHIVPSKTDRR